MSKRREVGLGVTGSMSVTVPVKKRGDGDVGRCTYMIRGRFEEEKRTFLWEKWFALLQGFQVYQTRKDKPGESSPRIHSVCFYFFFMFQVKKVACMTIYYFRVHG